MDLIYKIGITLIKGIGPVLAKNLIAYLGSAEAVFLEKPAVLAKIPEIGPVLSKQIAAQEVLERAKKEMDFIDKNNIHVYFYADKNYPYRLKECADAPVLLYTKGNVDFNAQRYIGMVGTRNASEYGKEMCKHLIEGLAIAQANTCIVSGLAYGIDIASHKAAVEYGLPTIAAVAHGLDILYPSAHRPTAIKMLDKGGLITEYLTGTNPDRQNFVQRNRLIAGLCDALVVVESASKGGSLITADLAHGYNRDVFAFPGRVGDDYSAGCNDLIRANKAALITSGADLVTAMGWELQLNSKGALQTCLFMELSEAEEKVIAIIRKQEAIGLNELALVLSLPISKLSPQLLEMEFKGLVKCLPGNIYKLRT